MRKERKEALMYAFPPVPYTIMEQMKGRSAANFCVFLTRGQELFVRCYHRYRNGEIAERQRYVFAKDGCVRYRYDHWCDTWKIASKFTEPRFILPGVYAHYHDNSYCILNANAYKESDMKYCPINEHMRYPMQFMRLYIRHPNIEYLFKAGYGHLVHYEEYDDLYRLSEHTYVDAVVNLKSNNLLRMLNLNRTEFKLLHNKEELYKEYIKYRKCFPKYKFQELIALSTAYGERGISDLQQHANHTGLSPLRISRYLIDNEIDYTHYSDYLDQCRALGYNLHDTAISLPHDFHVIHERLSALIKAQETELLLSMFKKHYVERLCYEYSDGDLIVLQPKSIDEIAQEGSVLSHCVGGYAERHAKWQTTIMFLRKSEEPDKPYYTMEIDSTGKIRQCYGYKNNRANNPKPPEIKTFEKHYEQYLQEVIHGKRNHSAARQSA